MSLWKYKIFNKNVDKKFQISLGEGNTSCTKCTDLAGHLSLDTVWLKREDMNPTGSSKDRGIAYQLSFHMMKGVKSFVLSSSGNAAISLAAYGLKTSLPIDIFISKNIENTKLNRLKDVLDTHIPTSKGNQKINIKNITVHITKKPRSEAITFSHKEKAFNLRGSLDEYAPKGYKSIAYELMEQCPNADALFIPTSSGTATFGIYQGYKEMKKSIPQIHIVQTTKVHAIAKKFDQSFSLTKTSTATAICDRIAHRRDKVIDIVKSTHGFGWVISDQEIQKAQEICKKYCSLDLSTDSALSLAGLTKALTIKKNFSKPVLLCTGK